MTENWITDRLPTKSDADDKGLVLCHHALSPYFFSSWYDVKIVQKWRHTPKRHSEPLLRKFSSITHADGRYLALADDGTAWFNYGDERGWQKLESLPDREVGQ